MCYRWDVIVQVGGVDVCGRMWGEQYILSMYIATQVTQCATERQCGQ